MSVSVRAYRRGGWEVDIRWRLPNGRRRRERTRVTITSRSAALRWGQTRERELVLNSANQQPKEVPTLEAFAPRFIEGHAQANRQKPGGIAQKEVILRVHLIPQFGKRRLDQIGNEDVQRLKHHLRRKDVKTVNNVLTVLNTMLKKAVEWQVLAFLPCTIRLLKTTQGSIDFYDFEEYETFVDAAAKTDAVALLIVLLGGDAGLRSGEMRALEWPDVNFNKRQMCVQRNDWRGHISTTKGGRLRYVPLAQRLADALRAQRHLRGARVLCHHDGSPLAEHTVTDILQRVARRANLRNNGAHILRHTFCSHLAMRGAPARAIQELAGHRDLTTTQRYMHLSPNAIVDAIRLLESGSPTTPRGDIGETALRGSSKFLMA